MHRCTTRKRNLIGTGRCVAALVCLSVLGACQSSRQSEPREPAVHMEKINGVSFAVLNVWVADTGGYGAPVICLGGKSFGAEDPRAMHDAVRALAAQYAQFRVRFVRPQDLRQREAVQLMQWMKEELKLTIDVSSAHRSS